MALIQGKPTEEDELLARKGLEEVKQALESGKYDVIILDEAAMANFFHLLSVEDLLGLIHQKPLPWN